MMKLTKEECENAIFNMNFLGEYKDGRPALLETEYPKEYAIIKQLISECFDNPPLRFEELKKGMWVWDNRFKLYRYIYDLSFQVGTYIEAGKYICFCPETSCLQYHELFKENRFYRREVKEDEKIYSYKRM